MFCVCLRVCRSRAINNDIQSFVLVTLFHFHPTSIDNRQVTRRFSTDMQVKSFIVFVFLAYLLTGFKWFYCIYQKYVSTFSVLILKMFIFICSSSGSGSSISDLASRLPVVWPNSIRFNIFCSHYER